LLRVIGLVGRDPVEGHLVARQEAAQLVAAGVETLAAQRGACPRRPRGQALQAAHALACLGRDRLRYLRASGRQRVVLPRIDTQHPRRLRGPRPAQERRPERDWHFAVEFAGVSLAQDSGQAVDQPHDLELARKDDVQRALVAFVHGIVTRFQVNVGRGACQRFEVGNRHARQQGDLCKFVGCQHAASSSSDCAAR
jgi:hypothetical protein